MESFQAHLDTDILVGWDTEEVCANGIMKKNWNRVHSEFDGIKLIQCEGPRAAIRDLEVRHET